MLYLFYFYSRTSFRQQQTKRFDYASTKESLTEEVPRTSSEKTRRDATHILKNILDRKPDDKEISPFIQVFQ